MKLHCGLELGLREIHAVLANDHGKVLIIKVMPNNAETLLTFLEPYKDQLCEITLEETENWRMIVGPLAEHGYQTVVI